MWKWMQISMWMLMLIYGDGDGDGDGNGGITIVRMRIFLSSSIKFNLKQQIVEQIHRTMNTTTGDKDGKTLSSMTYKHPIFDGEDTNKFKDWWDNTNVTLEMEDLLEEYVGEEDFPSKDLCTPTDLTNAAQVTAVHTNKLRRKETKKAKAHLVRVTKDFPKRLVMEATTPCEAYMALKTKYSVVKNRQDFTKQLDKEWNEFKVTDASSDPDKISRYARRIPRS